MLSTQSYAAPKTPVAASRSDRTQPAGDIQREVVQLNRVNLRSFIRDLNGLFVSVDFVKENGDTRTLTGRLGVKAYLKGGKNTVEADDRPYMTVFDVQLREYRTVNLATVSELRANGKIYRVV